jgi:hypothetical protein
MDVMRRVMIAGATAVAFGLIGATAHADVRTAAADDPQDAPPTVSGQPTNPDVKRVTASYDTAGSFTLTIDLYNALNAVDYSQNYAFWGTFSVGTWTDSGGGADSCSTSTQGSMSGQHHVYSAYSTFHDRASVTGYDGYLNFSRTTSPDGKQITITASNANIANRAYECIEYTLHARRRSTASNPNSDYDSGCDCWYVTIRADTTGEGATAERSTPIYFSGFAPPPRPACRDGRDNDGDGRTDYPSDPACSSREDSDEGGDPACDDKRDNDGDGKTDYPNDGECASSTDTDEAPPACADGADNDGDGRTDRDDWGCRTGSSEALALTPSYKSSTARKELRRALGRRFGDVFRKGTRYRVACRRDSRTKIVCQPTWTLGDLAFAGKVTLWLKRDGELVRSNWRGSVQRVNEPCVARKRAGDASYRKRSCRRSYALRGTRAI